MRQGCRPFKIGDSSVIICGGEPTDHKCNEKNTVYEFSDGFRGSLFDKAKQEGMNLNMCDEDKRFFLHERGITAIGASVACSICGRVAMDNVWFM